MPIVQKHQSTESIACKDSSITSNKGLQGLLHGPQTCPAQVLLQGAGLTHSILPAHPGIGSSVHVAAFDWEVLSNGLLREGGGMEERAQELSHSGSYKSPSWTVTALGLPISLVDIPPQSHCELKFFLSKASLCLCADVRPTPYLKSLFVDYSPFSFSLHRDFHQIKLSYFVLVCLGCYNKNKKEPDWVFETAHGYVTQLWLLEYRMWLPGQWDLG